MVDDMAKKFGDDGGLPDIYFNAAGSFFAYAMAHVAMKGIDVACFSQFVGSPPIEKWGISDMQFPSGTMISWDTGLGNAKYWVLKLFLDHVQKGDIIRQTTTTVPGEEIVKAPAQQFMCEAVGPWTFNNEITLTCNDPEARIEYIWADMGLTPSGQCGNYQPDKNCSNHLLATAWAAAQCLGRRSCTLTKESRVSQFLTCPIQTFVSKTVDIFAQRLTLQARCTGKQGGHTSAEYTGDSVFSVALISPDSKSKKLLLVNKLQHPVHVKITADELGVGGATAYIVDPSSVSRGAAQGIRQETWAATAVNASTVVTLQPYAVAFAVMGQGASEAAPIVI